MLQQKKLASAIAIAVGASVAALGTATNAGTILFPHIAVSPTVTTVITVMNAGDGWDQNGEKLHYRYYWKPWLDNTYNADDPNTVQVENQCAERNRYLPTSKNDIQTMDIGNVAFGSAGRGVMFLDESVNNDWDNNPVDYSLGANLPGNPAAHRAYLIVDNDDSHFYDDLAGEEIVFEVVNGASWGGQAFQNNEQEDYDFRRFASARYSLVAYMPPDEVTTKFAVTVLDDDMASGPTYGKTAHIGVRVLDPSASTSPGVFDRDENFYSGGIDRPVTCLGAWDIRDLYPDAVVTTPGGGWTNITNYAVRYNVDGIDVYPDRQTAAIFKVEFGDSVDGESVGGIYNNAIYLHPDYFFNGSDSVDEAVVQ